MKINNETKVGLMVVAVIALLVALTIKTGKIKLSEEGYHIKVRFSDIDGVNLNSPVMYNGYEVGMVEDIEIVEGPGGIQIELDLWVSDKARLKEGAKAYVKNLGFMGEKYVGLVSSEGGKDFLAEDSIIQGETPPDFGVLFDDAKDVLGQIKSISNNINERLEVNKDVLDELLLHSKDTMKNISMISENTRNRLEVNDERIDAIVANLQVLSDNFKELSEDLKLHPWKLLYRPKKKKGE